MMEFSSLISIRCSYKRQTRDGMKALQQRVCQVTAAEYYMFENINEQLRTQFEANAAICCVSLVSIHLPDASEGIVFLPPIIRTIVLSVLMVSVGSGYTSMRLRLQ